MISRAKTLIVLLRITGLVMMTAVVFIFCPLGWMDSIHRTLGLGPLPTGPIVEYLARTESALYAFLGVMLFFMSFDLARYRPLLRFGAWIAAGLSVGLIVLDARLGMPVSWTCTEGPFTLLLCTALLFLSQDKQLQ